MMKKELSDDIIYIFGAISDDSGYGASQGRCVGRNGRVEVRFADGSKILICGHAVTCIEGTIKI